MLKQDLTLELERPLPKGKNKKVIGLRAKTYSYLIDDCSEDKKSKRNKKVCHKKENFNLKIIKTL